MLQVLARLRESPCRGYDISDSGATPSSLSRCNKNRDRLLAEWSEKKPGGHALTWSGNVNDCIVCTVCTRTWPYSGGRMPWKTQIYQACPGNAVLAEQTRCSIRKEVSAVRSTHSLFLNLEVDKVECKKCHKTSAFIRGKPLLSQCASPRALPLGLRECSRLVQNKTPVRVGGVLLHRQWIKVGLCACATSKGVGRPSAVSTGSRCTRACPRTEGP